MLGFMVRVAARSAIRAAARSHVETVIDERRIAEMPFALHPRPGGDAALFQHRTVGFAHLVPGFPRVGTPTVSPTEHNHDAILALYTLPVCIRYHASRPHVAAANAQDFATRVAHYYIGQRAAAPPVIRAAHGGLLDAWAVEAGAMARYDLAYPDPFGADHEELVLVVRAGHAMAITYRYARADVHWVARAFFVSAANASLSWDAARLHHAQIWPVGSFLEPGLQATLLPQRLAEVPHIAAQMALQPAEREVLGVKLATILESEEPPWIPIAPNVAAARVAELSATSPNPGLRAVVERQMYGVRSMHDLRGLALQLGRALEPNAGARP